MSCQLRVLWALGVLFFLSAQASGAVPGSFTAQTYAEFPCASGERWIYGASVSEAVRGEFDAFLSGNRTLPRALSDAFARRRFAASETEKVLSEYWIARVLMMAGLFHPAHEGLSVIAVYEPSVRIIGVQIAALQCLNELKAQLPMALPALAVTARLSSYMGLIQRPEDRHVVWDFSFRSLLTSLGVGSTSKAEAMLTILRGAGAREEMARAFVAINKGANAQAINYFERAFALLSQDVYSAMRLKKNSDRAHLLFARALYSDGRFDRAIAEYRKISSHSNEFVQALSELAWSHYAKNGLMESIGTALGLQAGGLRRTFAPESLMLMAMSLNELCQYPESLRAVELFRSSYQRAYHWLKLRSSEAPVDINSLAVAHMLRKGEVPEQVASEWIRSPVFIAGQEELNLLQTEARSIQGMSRQGGVIQKALGKKIQKLAALTLKRIHDERMMQKTYAVGITGLSTALKKEVADLRLEIDHYRKLRSGARLWSQIVSNHSKAAPQIRTRLLASINSDLRRRNERMLRQLEEIAENNQLLEIEIYHGATEDIIWQNAYPDYPKVAKTLHAQAWQMNAAKVWRWVEAPLGAESWSEIWEDELGSFKANLFDNCSSKDRYLTVKRTQLTDSKDSSL